MVEKCQKKRRKRGKTGAEEEKRGKDDRERIKRADHMGKERRKEYS